VFLVGLPFLVKPPLYAVLLVIDDFLFLAVAAAAAIPALVLVVSDTGLSTGWLDKMYWQWSNDL
jgi:hypothetical protein